MEKAIQHIATEIIAAKPDLNGWTPRGVAEKLLSEAKETLPKTTMNKINYAIKNLKKQLKNGAFNVTGSNISSLTDGNNPGTFTNSDDESLNSKAASTSSHTSNSDASYDCSTLKSKDSSNLFVLSDCIQKKQLLNKVAIQKILLMLP